MKTRIKELIKLFLTFLKIGCIAFGGGYAMVALIERELVEKKGWLTHDEMLQAVVLSESTPGPIAINMATYIGTKRGGFFGALVATFGVVFPAFAIIIAISFVLPLVKENFYVNNIFKGLRAGVCVLIIASVYKFFKKLEKSIFAIIMFVAALCVSFFTSFSTIYILMIAAVIGIIYCLIENHIKNKKGDKEQ